MDTTNDAGNDKSVGQRQACDHCKIRKTKCDRKSPCSSCVAAKVPCRVTRRTPEKRQRVLLSSKYDEAMGNVNERLIEISATLQKMALDKGYQPKQTVDASNDIAIVEKLTDVSAIYEGFTGDSSLHAHVEQAANALNSAYALHPKSVLGMKQAEQAGDDGRGNHEAAGASSSSQQGQSPSLESLPLPRMDPVLRLLRLSQSEKQRFFLDFVILTEYEFTALCQQVYFATEPYDLTTWILVNVGLAFMFKSLREHHFAQIGVDAVEVETNIRLLTMNLDIAVQRLKLCLETTVEGCQALALFAAFFVNTGRIAIAWKLVTAAARMCLDLGLHRLPPKAHGREAIKKNLLFWTVYAWDKGMALCLGRAPSIHQYDVTSPSPSFGEEMAGMPVHVFMGFHDYAIAAGDIHRELFSASAMKDTQSNRVRRANEIASRLAQTQRAFQEVYNKYPDGSTVRDQSMMLDIILYCLLTVVMRVIPVNKPGPHSLQCCNECVFAARQALMMLYNTGLKRQHDPGKWSMYLNTVFSFVPFLPFIVIVGNAIATSSTADLRLLSSLLATMEPAARVTPAIRKLCDVCHDFYQIADRVVAQDASKAAVMATAARLPQPVKQVPLPAQTNLNAPFAQPEELTYNTGDIPMSQQDWSSVVNQFDLNMDGLDVEAIATYMEPYINDSSM